MWTARSTAAGSGASRTGSTWVGRYGEDVQEGPYVDGKMHGRWVTRGWSDGDVKIGTYVNGEKQ